MENQTAADLRNLLAWVQGPGPVNPKIRLNYLDPHNEPAVGVEIQLELDETALGSVSGNTAVVSYQFVAKAGSNGFVALRLRYISRTLEGRVTEYIQFDVRFEEALEGSVEQVLARAIEIVARNEPDNTQVAFMPPHQTGGGVPRAIENADIKKYDDVTMPEAIKRHAPKLYQMYQALLAQHQFGSVVKNALGTVGAAPKEQWPLYQNAFADLAAMTPAAIMDDTHLVVLAGGKSAPEPCTNNEDLITAEPFRMGDLVVANPKNGECTSLETHIKYLADGHDHDPFGVPYGERWGLAPVTGPD